MVRTILAIVFDNEDQRVERVPTVRQCLDQLANGEVVVRLLRFRCVNARKSGIEVAHMIMAHTEKGQAGKVAASNVLVELPLPLVIAPQVRIVLVVTAEVEIGESHEGRGE